MCWLDKVGRAIRNPGRLLEHIWDQIVPPSFLEGLQWDKLERMAYAYGLYQAALEAKALGIPAISAVEFGVAGGNGLVALERYAEHVERERRCAVMCSGSTWAYRRRSTIGTCLTSGDPVSSRWTWNS
jgi:hypothetical protein